MAETTTDAGNESIRAWYKEQLDAVVKEMLRIEAVSGAAVEAAPIWAAPNRILIAKVWQAGRKNYFIWTISGESVHMDHIRGSMAATPRDAARHFSLKWQMDADRLINLANKKTPDGKTRANVEAFGNKLIQQAEFLYSMVEQDAGWEPVGNA